MNLIGYVFMAVLLLPFGLLAYFLLAYFFASQTERAERNAAWRSY